jgi:hypothetical protein
MALDLADKLVDRNFWSNKGIEVTQEAIDKKPIVKDRILKNLEGDSGSIEFCKLILGPVKEKVTCRSFPEKHVKELIEAFAQFSPKMYPENRIKLTEVLVFMAGRCSTPDDCMVRLNSLLKDEERIKENVFGDIVLYASNSKFPLFCIDVFYYFAVSFFEISKIKSEQILLVKENRDIFLRLMNEHALKIGIPDEISDEIWQSTLDHSGSETSYDTLPIKSKCITEMHEDPLAIEALELFYGLYFRAFSNFCVTNLQKMHPENRDRMKELLICLLPGLDHEAYQKKAMPIVGNPDTITLNGLQYPQFCVDMFFCAGIESAKKSIWALCMMCDKVLSNFRNFYKTKPLKHYDIEEEAYGDDEIDDIDPVEWDPEDYFPNWIPQKAENK